MISIVIPALDEEASIVRAIRSCRVAGPCEVIVVDGGSRDRTVEIARAEADAVIAAARGRAAQMNAGAAVARGAACRPIRQHGGARLHSRERAARAQRA